MGEPFQSPSDASDLGLPRFESPPKRHLGTISWSEWMDEIEPYLRHYQKLEAEGKALPRRTPWEGKFEL